jgi:hypothetical protein
MIDRISEDLSLLGSDCRVSTFQWPSGRVDLETVFRGKKDGRVLEGAKKHGKAVCEGATTETKRVHKRSCEDGGVASVTVAQEALERSEEF